MRQVFPFRPLSDTVTQYHIGTGLHTLGLLKWILQQTGRADVYVSTFSTSDAFLSGFLRLRRRKLIDKATLVADLKAARKTVQLYKLMQSCFDHVHLAQIIQRLCSSSLLTTMFRSSARKSNLRRPR